MSSFFVTDDTCLRDPCDCPEEKELGLWHSVLMARRLQGGPSANVPHDYPGTDGCTDRDERCTATTPEIY